MGVVLYLVAFNPRYERKVKQFAPNPVPPEYRLEICVVAAPFFAGAFFWFGWTSFRSVSFWAPMLAGLPLGASIVFLFLGLFNYTIDAYLFVAASALSSMTVVRSLFGAGFPLFATQMYQTLNPRWASTLLGCIAVVMAPIPFVLRAYGHCVRSGDYQLATVAGHVVVDPALECLQQRGLAVIAAAHDHGHALGNAHAGDFRAIAERQRDPQVLG